MAYRLPLLMTRFGLSSLDPFTLPFPAFPFPSLPSPFLPFRICTSTRQYHFSISSTVMVMYDAAASTITPCYFSFTCNQTIPYIPKIIQEKVDCVKLNVTQHDSKNKIGRKLRIDYYILNTIISKVCDNKSEIIYFT